MASRAGSTVSKELSQIINALCMKDCLTPPSSFYKGDDIEEFINSVDTYCAAYQADETFKIAFLTNHLDKEVRIGIYALPEFAKDGGNYEWLCKQLKSAYKKKLLKLHRWYCC